jgi:membrane-bound serine protease (ClpP class)
MPQGVPPPAARGRAAATGRRRSRRRRVAFLLAALTGLALFRLTPGGAQPARPVVTVVAIEGTIDLGLAPFLTRVLEESAEARRAAVLLEINTFGGRVDAAVVMRDALLNAPLPTIAFVNQRAISAGALIALACETIVMAEAATIGAALPVQAGAGEPQPTDEKTVSYVRKEFAATAERRGRHPAIAEAMVDPDVVIPGLVEKGKLLTLSTSEALAHKVAEHRAPSVAAALAAVGLPDADLRRAETTWAEDVVRFLTGPIISSLLMTIGLLGLLVEIRTPGFGFAGGLGLISLGLFFWGHWIVQLAGWEEVLLVAAGLVLIGLEVFALPGFGVAGLAGILLLVGGLALTLVGAGATAATLVSALGRVAASLLLALAGGLALLRVLPRLPVGRRLVLGSAMTAAQGYASPPDRDRTYLGRTGVALSPLRPAGIADIGGARVDVVSDGSFIEAGAAIVVTDVEGNRVVVRRTSLDRSLENG